MPREAFLARTLVELADNLVDDYEIVDLLSLLSDRCVEALAVDAAGVMIAGPAGQLELIASSSTAMRRLELFELQADEGPCLDAYRESVVVRSDDLAGVEDRWLRFAPAALGAGFHAVLALPMRLRDTTIGALNLFMRPAAGLDEADVEATKAFAAVATIAILQHRLVLDAQVLNGQLSQALNSRVVIEQANGRISEAAGVSIEEAFHRLRNHARNHNIRLTDLAARVADGSVSSSSLDPARHRRRN